MADLMQVEIISDGRTVWVNSPSGMCIGRFSKFGVDIHHDVEGQSEGKHCLDCVHDLPPTVSWERFCSSMLQHYGVVIHEKHRPGFAASADHG